MKLMVQINFYTGQRRSERIVRSSKGAKDCSTEINRESATTASVLVSETKTNLKLRDF